MPSFGGRYKGTRFRSLLELSVVLEAENDGYKLGEDLLYETVRIPYGNSGREYVVDFHLVPEKTLIEVKPSSRVGTKTAKSKFKAANEYARRRGMTFVVVTEKDIGDVLTLERASKLADVEWGVRAKRSLRRGRNKASRRAKRSGT